MPFAYICTSRLLSIFLLLASRTLVHRRQEFEAEDAKPTVGSLPMDGLINEPEEVSNTDLSVCVPKRVSPSVRYYGFD